MFDLEASLLKAFTVRKLNQEKFYLEWLRGHANVRREPLGWLFALWMVGLPWGSDVLEFLERLNIKMRMLLQLIFSGYVELGGRLVLWSWRTFWFAYSATGKLPVSRSFRTMSGTFTKLVISIGVI